MATYRNCLIKAPKSEQIYPNSTEDVKAYHGLENLTLIIIHTNEEKQERKG